MGCSHCSACIDGPAPRVEVLKEEVESPCEAMERWAKYTPDVEEPLEDPSHSAQGRGTSCCSWNLGIQAIQNWQCSWWRLGHNPAAKISEPPTSLIIRMHGEFEENVTQWITDIAGICGKMHKGVWSTNSDKIQEQCEDQNKKKYRTNKQILSWLISESLDEKLWKK